MDREWREDAEQHETPHERHPDVGVGRRSEPQRAHRVDHGRERVGLRELPQAVGHRLRGDERRGRERQREDRGEADRVRRLRRRREQADEREDPRERVAEQQQQEDSEHDLADRRVLEVEPADDPDDQQHGQRQAVEQDVRQRPPGQHRGARHRQRAEAVDQALLDILGEPERGHEPAEGDRLDDDAGDQEVDVIEARRHDRAAEDVDEQQHEHHRLHRVGDQQVGLARDPLEVAARQDDRVRDRVGEAHAATSSASAASSAAWPVVQE